MGSRRDEYRAQLDANRDRELWGARITMPNGTTLLDVYEVERAALAELLASLLFTHALTPDRGDYLRVNVYPVRPRG